MSFTKEIFDKAVALLDNIPNEEFIDLMNEASKWEEITSVSANPFSGSLEDIETIALIVRKKFNTALNPSNELKNGKFLREVVKTLKGTIEVTNIYESSGIDILDSENFTIYLSATSGPLADNYTIAHELGHYFLHYLFSKDQISYFARYGNIKMNQQANRFALAFLIPRDEFEELWTANKDLAFILSHKYEVPSSIIELRAKSLGLY